MASSRLASVPPESVVMDRDKSRQRLPKMGRHSSGPAGIQRTARCPRLLAISCLTVAVSAQTYLVDAANGPQTNYTSIAAATAAVPDGSTLIVRAGSYAGFSILAKGLTVLGEAGVVITGPVDVCNTQVSQRVELRELTWQQAAAHQPVPHLTCLRCGGLVVLHSLSVPHVHCALATCSNPRAVETDQCEQLLVQQCTIAGSVELVLSRAVILGSTVTGRSYQQGGALPAIEHSGASTMQIRDSAIHGGAGWSFFGQTFPGREAIRKFGPGGGSSMRLLSGLVQRGNHYNYAIRGGGALRIDPAVTVIGIIEGAATTLSMPSVAATAAGVGGAMTATVTAPVGDLFALLVGFSGAPLSLPGFDDAIWLNPTLTAQHGTGFGGAPFATSLAVPNDPSFNGLRVTWTAISLDAATNALQASNPSLSAVQ